MRVGSLFSGIGGFDLGLERAGMRVAWQCEADPFCREVLARHWPDVPCYADVCELRGADVASVDVLCGGFPCQDISLAGKGGGINAARSGLWGEYARLVCELRPRYVLVENVANILALHDGAIWSEVLGDLAAARYDIEWDCVPAAAFGAPHLRDRVFAVATDSDVCTVEPGWLWRRERGAVEATTPDADASARGPRAGQLPWEGGAGRQDGNGARRGATALADTGGDELRIEPQPVAWRGSASLPARASARGIEVEWGEYSAAIERWSEVVGAAPEPLVHRVDDGRTSGVERSRLSALGDGVLVQAGRLVGSRIMEHAMSGSRAENGQAGL